MFLLSDSALCNDCFKCIEPVCSINIHLTRTVKISVHAIGAYKDPLKYFILAKGWRDRTASRQLGLLIWQTTPIKHNRFDCIVPIPLHWSREMLRGFNQANVMAMALSALSGKPIVYLIRRAKATEYQFRLSGIDRQTNVKNVFVQDIDLIKQYQDKDILMIDDLMTTGATLQEAGRELLRYNPRSITAVVGARVCV